MKYTTQLLSIGAALLLWSIAIGQPTNSYVNDVVIPSPNGATLGSFTNIPVSYSTGLPSIGVPIHTVQYGPLSVPLSLSYHPGGVRLGETASWVGQNWALNASSWMVHRTIQSYPDEKTNGFYANPAALSNNFCSASCPTYDTEPDIFSANYPGGSFKFYFDSTRTIVKIQQDNDDKIRLITNIGSITFAGFEIIGTDGTKYIFGQKDASGPSARETSSFSSTAYPTGWSLLSMTSYDDNQEIVFNYTTESYNLISKASQGHTISNTGISTSNVGTNPFASLHYREVPTSSPRLTSITTANEEVVFHPSTADREDLPSTKSLDKITIEPISSTAYCKTFELDYDYFIDKDHSSYAFSKRLQLTQVQEISCDQTVSKNPYVFEYTGTIHSGKIHLPNRISNQIDHWGYWNGKTNNDNYTVNVPISTNYHQTGSYTYGLSNREVDTNFVKQGVLSKVTYPTGGSSSFVMESNEAPQTINSSTTQDLYSTTSCTPGSSQCCNSLTFNSSTMSFTTNQIANMRFDLEGLVVPPSTCSTGRTVTFSVWDGSTQVGNDYEFSMDSSGTHKTQPIVMEGILVSDVAILTTGINYTFRLETNNSYGRLRVYTVTNTSSEQNIHGPGLRVKQITFHDNLSTANDIIKQYDYTESEASSIGSGTILVNQPNYTSSYSNTDNTGGGYVLEWSDVPNSTITDIVGNNIIYGRVKEYINGNGYTEYHYNNSSSYPITGTAPCIDLHASQRATCAGGCEALPFTSNIASRGKMTQQKTFNQSNQLLHSITHTYTNQTSDSAYPMLKRRIFGCPNSVYTFYKIQSFKSHLTQTVEYKDGVTTTVTKGYDTQGRHSFPVSSSMTNSDGKIYTTEYVYPYDYSNQVLLKGLLPIDPTEIVYTQHIQDSLLAQNRIIPWMTLNTVTEAGQTTLIDGQATLYDFFLLNFGSYSMPHLFFGTQPVSEPYPSFYYRYQATWDEQGDFDNTDGWVSQLENTHYNVDVGQPKEVQIRGWSDPIFYTWSTTSLLTDIDYKAYNKSYDYISNTYLLETFKDIDDTELSYAYDDLIRLSLVTNCQDVEQSLSYLYYDSGQDNHIITKTKYLQFGHQLSLREISDYSFFDGLGRSRQMIRADQDPSADDEHILTQTKYDTQGRKIREDEPVNIGTNLFDQIVNITATGSTYTYEPSPLDRPASSTPPAWYATTMAYGSNTSTDAVKNHNTGINYAVGALYKQVTIDPEGQATEIYTDKRGRQILSRVKATATTTNTAEIADTYTIYDDKDRPTLIIPPDAELTDTGLIFKMVYSADDHVIIQDNPDQEPIQMVYDDRDLMTYRQDGNMKHDNHWYAYAYDDYGRTITEGFAADSLSSITDVLIQNTYGTAGAEKGKLKTASQKVLNGSDITLSQEYIYDACGRNTLIKSNSILHPTPGSIVDSLILDDRDMAVESYQKIIPDNITIKRRQTYDHAGREKKAFIQITTPEQTWPEQELSDKSYTVKEQISTLNLGAGLQNVDYSYLDNGYLSSINDPDNMGSDLFAMNLGYNSDISGGLATGITTLQDGNISHATWKAAGENKQAYQYNYDFLKRLKDANYFQSGNNGDYTTHYTYKDHRGNFNTVSRMSPDGMIDDLNYSYYPGTNMIKSISEGAVIPSIKGKGYKANEALEYVWDSNGNIAQDPSKTSYFINNHLNLPDQISIPDSGFINRYYYDVSGLLHRVEELRDNTVYSYRDYLFGGAVEFYNGVFDQTHLNHVTIELNYNIPKHLIRTGIETGITQQGVGIQSDALVPESIAIIYEAGKYVSLSSGFEVDLGADFTARIDTFPVTGLTLIYHISDQVGNRRVVFSDLNNNGSIQTSEVFGTYNNYPFGLRMEDGSMDYTDRFRYLTKGHELQTNFGLNYKRSAYRFKDDGANIWLSVDPLQNAPKNIRFSSYIPMWNNPVMYSDEDGRTPGGGGGSLAWVAEGFRQYFQAAAKIVDNVKASVSNTVKSIVGRNTSGTIQTETSHSNTDAITVHTNFEQIFAQNGNSNSPAIDKPLLSVEKTSTTKVNNTTSIKLNTATLSFNQEEKTNGATAQKSSFSVGSSAFKGSIFYKESNNSGEISTSTGLEVSTTFKTENSITKETSSTLKFSIYIQNDK